MQGLRLLCPSSRGKCGDFTSGKARGDWEPVLLCFCSIDEKIAGENEVCVLTSVIFFCARNRPSVKYFYEQNNRTAGGEFRKEKITVQRT